MKSDSPFLPGRPISGFKTGPQGMGHAFLHVKQISHVKKITCKTCLHD